ncbi:hypothetical protein Glove_117g198 [Diversispora epigaea]|uniref:Uncharacterized protein n=1 Tax=Diversispora epigaea TaxID=1348612 RepID=A0A397J8S6_9GLOM|nr:hypothetical protein Glove_117g198 [Diversispora epigaea]
MELSYNTHENFFLFVIYYKRQNNVKTWVKHLSVFDKGLNSEYQVPPIEVRHKYDEMVRIVAPLCKSFEECAIQLHHYTPQDEIDKVIFCLFANKKNNLKELFEALQEIIKNRENNLNNNKNNSNVQLVDLWDKCLIPQCKQASRLQGLYVKGAKIYRWVLERRALIEEGIRPTSFFQRLFRLLEEENEENLVDRI